MRIDSSPVKDGFFMPAEFSRHIATIMIYPERPGSWSYEAKKAGPVFEGIIKEIAAHEKVYVIVSDNTEDKARRAFAGIDSIEILNIPTDDSWARDTAPTFVVSRKDGTVRGINWRFNAWGGDFDGLYAHWDKDDALAKAFCDRTGFDCYDADPFVLEGGSVHSDGAGTLMVTESCLLSKGRNPELSKSEIEDKLKEYLGATRVIWLPRGIYNDETNEHVDNVCAFITPGEVVLAWTDNTEDPQYELSLACLQTLEKEGIKVHKLPIPDVPVTVQAEDLEGYVFEEGEDTREVGERLAASYVNFYFANDIVLVPQFGGENAESDKRAVEILAGLCKPRTVVPIPARDIILGGGNIHCITQQIPAGEA
ncbi:MAG: agmatine deiminase [Lachnospiraceae bacterium]|nr:agmatine deiminase [Lachnospiraceae bacterium]